MLRIEDLTYRIGARVLFDQTDAAVNPGHRVGLVGRNGTGKTTLLRLITGALAADGGAIHVPARWRGGWGLGGLGGPPRRFQPPPAGPPAPPGPGGVGGRLATRRDHTIDADEPAVVLLTGVER